MSKEKGFKGFCIYLFYGITAVQIVFAVIWLCLNITGYREEFISDNYIKAAMTLKVDDYMGILYALIVRLLGHGTILYIFQILTVFASLYFLPVKSKVMRLVLGLNVITNPFILQSECTVRPEILLFAGMIALMTAVIKEKIYLICIFVTILVLLNPDYIFICLAIVIPVALCFLIKRKKAKVAIVTAGLAISFVLSALVNNAATDVYAYGNVEKSFNFLCMQRFAGGDISIYHDIIRTCYDSDLSYEMSQADKTPERLSLSFGTSMERVGGKENAEALYEVITRNAIAKGPRYYGPAIIRDYVYYLLTPIATGYVLRNQLTGTLIFNPVRMFTGKLYYPFKAYIYFGALSACIFIVLCASLYIIRCINKESKEVNPALALIILISIVLAFYGIFGCLRGFDYRNALFNVAAWPILFTLLLEKKEEI